jgi:hypothetical protein
VSRRNIELSLLAVLVLIAVWVYLASRNHVPGMRVISAEGLFQPLSVRERELRLDEVMGVLRLVYSGTQRNIFIATPPPPEPTAAQKAAEEASKHLIRTVNLPPEQPLVVPAQFFGYAFSKSGRRVAFFSAGDDVFVVPEGDVFMSHYRVVKIGSDSVDVDETTSGKHAKLQMLQPTADSGAGTQAGFQPGQSVPQ